MRAQQAFSQVCCHFFFFFLQSSWCLVSRVSEKYAWLCFFQLDFSTISSSRLCRADYQWIRWNWLRLQKDFSPICWMNACEYLCVCQWSRKTFDFFHWYSICLACSSALFQHPQKKKRERLSDKTDWQHGIEPAVKKHPGEINQCKVDQEQIKDGGREGLYKKCMMVNSCFQFHVHLVQLNG